MFNDKYGLTASVLNGTKTMTRRIVSAKTLGRYDNYDDFCRNVGTSGLSVQRLWEAEFFLPYSAYKVGDVVAVAQNYQEAIHEYKRLGDIAGWGKLIANTENGCAGYRHKLFVRPELMPHRIRITDVRVERLQDITDEDCMAEGIIEDCQGVQYSFPSNIGYCGQFPYDNPRLAFAVLTDKVSGKGTWDSNPWVYVYTFFLSKL